MSSLSYVDKERMARFFGFSGGYIFDFLVRRKAYNKNNTRDMILEATGIDIYKEPDYDMSQERCVRAIWDTCDDYVVGKLLKVMLDFYYSVADWSWEYKEEQDYEYLRSLQEKLMSRTVDLPPASTETLELIREDIERNIKNNTPELAIDRLHTFTIELMRSLCDKHNISTVDNQGAAYPLHSLVGMLKNWYKNHSYFESDFCVVAFQNTISIFEKYNALRNGNSAAHPSALLNKVEAEYAIRIVAETLSFIESIETIKDSETEEKNLLPWKTDSSEDDLPF